MPSWLYSWTGVGPQANGWCYSFWSGFGSCLTYIGIVVAGWRHLNCHAKGCWRVGRHTVDGTPFKVCRRHHPAIPNKGATVEEIHQAHREATCSSPS